MKICDGAIAHVSTVMGGYGGQDTDGTLDVGSMLDSGSNGGSTAGSTAYIVVAGEDGAVRFYDLKFRIEVRHLVCGLILHLCLCLG